MNFKHNGEIHMKAVLIGIYGHQGYLLSGAKALKDFSIAAIAQSNPEEDISRMVKYLSTENIKVKIYDDWRKMLDAEKPDIASISPMFCDHQKISVECLKRNIHVVCEKPVAMNFTELDELEKAYRESKAEFVGMHAMRYQPNFYAGYEALKSGLIGKPILINSQKSYAFSTDRPQFYKDRNKFGGSLCWVAIHALDWTYWMAGPFENVFAAHTTIGNMGYDSCESSGVIAFKFKNGGQGCVNFDFLKAHKDKIPQDRCRIAGAKGVIEIHEDKAWIVTHDEERRELELKPDANFFKCFVDSIRGEGECLLNAEDTFNVTRIALAARDSADKNILIKL
jgi:predicted dehydrogenase